MQNILRRVITCGVRPDLPFKEQNKIRIFNTTCFIVFWLTAFYLGVNIVNHFTLAAWVCGAYILSLFGGFMIVRNGRRSFAFHYTLILGNLFIFFNAITTGYITQTHMFFMFMPVAALVLFDGARIHVFYFVFAMIFMVLAIVYYQLREPLYKMPEHSEVFGTLNVLVTGLLLFLSTRRFKIENGKFTEAIETQKELLAERNKDISDSINYAKRIQEAMLPEKEIKYRLFPDAFVMLLPKDVVSGDFYWFGEQKGRRIIAAVDCTGHGVPGAFMSMIGNAFLEEIVHGEGITRPDLILNKMREMVIKSLKQNGVRETENKDGMDIAVCSFEGDFSSVQFAGANNPMWVIRKGEETIREIKGDKQPIGVYAGESGPFTYNEIKLSQGDQVYIFTDGYADQFGGESGKKYKYARLEKLILGIRSLPMLKQEEILREKHIEWKGELEQVDDITVIGVRI